MTERCESSASKTLDEDRLHDLGYYQSLKRDWSLVHNFGASFSIIVSFMLKDLEAKKARLQLHRALSLESPRMKLYAHWG